MQDGGSINSVEETSYEKAEVHAAVFLVYLRDLLEERSFLDVAVCSDGLFVTNAHRLLLSAFSSHFEMVLASAPNRGKITVDIDSKITGVDWFDLLKIVNYMYSGRCSNTDRHKTLKAARALSCSSLIKLLETKEAIIYPGAQLEDSLHAQKLLQAMYRFKVEGKFTDCTVSCQKMPLICCHRLMLCAYSELFEDALANTSCHPELSVDIDPEITAVSSTDLRNVVDFMYTGLIRTLPRRFILLKRAAIILRVNRLVNALEAEMADYCPLDDYYTVSTVSPTSSLVSDRQDIFEVSAIDHKGNNVMEKKSAKENVRKFVRCRDEESVIFDLNISENEDYVFRGKHRCDESTIKQAVKDYSLIYENYVAGPKRGRRDGTYGVGHLGSQTGRAAELEAESGSKEQPNCNISLSEGSLALPSIFPRKDDRHENSESGLMKSTNSTELVVGDQEKMMEKPFKCTFCDHRAREKSAVIKHMRSIHTLEAPYKCQYCDQSFKVQSNLARHIRAHTGEKPYLCKICGILYADKKNMDAHVFREHLRMNRYECDHCSAKFWRKDRMALHCRRIHNCEPTNL